MGNCVVKNSHVLSHYYFWMVGVKMPVESNFELCGGV